MHRLSACQLHKQFVLGELSAETIAERTFSRIEQYNETLGAFLTLLKKRALSQAKALDEKRKKGSPLGKLAGVPIAIKDNIHIKGELTTCASHFLSNYRAFFSATVISLLEQEDALLIGKTNMDEFAMGGSGKHSAFTLTRNPWDLNLTPGGSSSGSAAAVSARLCPLALGTDTGGSIRQPAAFSGIVGFKPTYGRVSRYGLVAFGSSLDQIGPLATCVEDASLVMEVIGKHCARDSTSISTPPVPYSAEMKKPLSQARIGVPWSFLDSLSVESRRNFEEALNVFKELGAKIVEVDLGILKYGIATYYILATAEASTNLARFDGIRYGLRSKNATTLEEIYDFSREEGFGAEVKSRILLGTYVLSGGYEEAHYTKAQKVRTLLIKQFREAFAFCDMIATPTSPGTAIALDALNDPLEEYLQDLYTTAANLAGLPAISIPSGLSSQGNPFGLQLMGPQTKDAEVLQFAYAFEQKTPFHTLVPSFGGLR